MTMMLKIMKASNFYNTFRFFLPVHLFLTNKKQIDPRGRTKGKKTLLGSYKMCMRFMNFAKFSIKLMSISSQQTLNQKSLLSGGLLLERLLSMTFQFLCIQPNPQGKIFKKKLLSIATTHHHHQHNKNPKAFLPTYIYLLLWREHNQPNAQKIIMYLPFHHSITVIHTFM